MRTRIKFCGLVRAADVDAAVSLGADLVGFVFYARSPRAIDVQTSAMLRGRLPSYVAAAGLFVNEGPARAAPTTSTAPLDFLEFHGDVAPDACIYPGRRAR